MLIPSERHTAVDLALWDEMEEADRVHYRVGGVADKTSRSVDCIREFAAAGACYCSVSWGKDSVVLAHLVAVAGCPDVPLAHLSVLPAPNPHTPAVRDAFLAAWPVRYFELTHTSLFGVAGPAERMRAKKGSFGAGFVRAGLPPRYISGVRAGESGARRIRMRSHGSTTAATCAPIGWLTTADVFAYLAEHGLPVHPNYAMTGGGRWPRDRIRVSELGGEFGNEYGRGEWEREYYGDVLRRLEAGANG